MAASTGISMIPAPEHPINPRLQFRFPGQPLTTRQTETLARRGGIKQGNFHLESMTPPNGGGIIFAAGPDLFTTVQS
ncbi:hypothetical protein [Kerstersia gyiorum]|jgi:hypothetical protein|nr:hypothetical protein [Kerstersia gyiorum]MCH4270176.1 hypothetical protein [Kerstersia gyiorum]MCI1229779.1 hypothetical protein [Kerstersia gyiorum]